MSSISRLPPSRDAAAYHVIIPAAGCSRRMAHLTADRPKSLLEIDGRSIIAHSLETLNAFGFTRVTFVVGYQRDLFVATLGERFRGIAIDYVVNEDYETTEHGWSLCVTGERWREERRPVVFMDADNLYDPDMLTAMLGSSHPDLMLVDDTFATGDREEELVTGRVGVIERLVRGRDDEVEGYAGAFVGINRFSAEFMDALYRYMDGFFAARGRMFKYERVFDAFIRDTGAEVHYLPTRGLPWINVNHEDEYQAARDIAARMAAVALAGGAR